jgi:DNA-binding transcriptional ArsR family regulator
MTFEVLAANEKDKQITEDTQRVRIFAALADPLRIETIRTLKHVGGELPVAELRERSGYGQTPATRSYHGKILHDAGLTIVRKSGREKFVRLNNETFAKYLPGFLDTL